MKKVSTVAAKQSRNISQQKLTIGLDLGDRNSWYCVLEVNPARYGWSSECGRMQKGCAKSSGPCRAVGSHWKSGRIPLGSVACSASWGMKHRGQCAQGAADRGEPQERRSTGCADAGAVSPDRSRVAVSGEAS